MLKQSFSLVALKLNAKPCLGVVVVVVVVQVVPKSLAIVPNRPALPIEVDSNNGKLEIVTM